MRFRCPTRLSGRDRDKLDEYCTSVRDIEQRIEHREKFRTADADAPAGMPRKFSEYVRLMYDMLHLAFQTDSTRIATFMLAGDGSNRNFSEIGISEGHHSLSHHRNDPETMKKVAAIDRWYVQQLAYFLAKMENTKDVDGNSLLHNSMIVYGSGHCDGNRHTHVNLPIILAGAGGGTLTPGRYVKQKPAPDDQPLPQHDRPHGRQEREESWRLHGTPRRHLRVPSSWPAVAAR